MKILYLTFYFEPDLGPGAFRNTALVNELSCQLSPDSHIHVMTTQPNRYQSFKPVAPAYENRDYGDCPIVVERITVPAHANGMLDQIRSFWVYFRAVHRLTKNREYDLVVASSSRLFTAFLGAQLARKQRIPLFLDIRDLFREAILDVIKNHWSRRVALINRLIRLVLNAVLHAVERYTFGYARHINLVSEGFQSYFHPFPKATYSYFTNGIDDAFLDLPASEPSPDKPIKTILYAGNIGEGQGLHTIIPQAAQQLSNGYRFIVIGDGGARQKLEAAIDRENIKNVELRPSINRQMLPAEYQNADYLLVHLNDLEACRRVLPSKLFEYGATDKPILAGVAGYAALFIREYLPNSLLFQPGDMEELVNQLCRTPYRTQARTEFKAKFQRQAISQKIVRQILQTASSRQPEPIQSALA